VAGLDDRLRAQARVWAEETALTQGLPARVVDHDVLRSVAALLGLKRSVAPDGGQAHGVEAVVAAPTRPDDDVLQEGGDDLLLAG
jgi:hypothetical protein